MELKLHRTALRDTYTKHTNMTSLPTGDSGIPSGWMVENATE